MDEVLGNFRGPPEVLTKTIPEMFDADSFGMLAIYAHMLLGVPCIRSTLIGERFVPTPPISIQSFGSELASQGSLATMLPEVMIFGAVLYRMM